MCGHAADGQAYPRVAALSRSPTEDMVIAAVE
jgi:hypothetical protein